MAKSKFSLRCPHCTNNISLLKVREEFICPTCGSMIKCGNYLEISLKSLAIYFAVTFVFYFVSFNIITVTLDIIIFFAVMLKCSEKLECSILRGPSDK